MRAAAKKAITMRPIPDLAARTGAAVAAAIALDSVGMTEPAGSLLASVERSVAEANGGQLFALLGMRRPRQGNLQTEHARREPTSR